MTKLAMMVTVDVESGDVEQIRADVFAALTELMRGGVTAADAEVSAMISDASEVSALISQIARMDTFEDKAIRTAIEAGERDPMVIAEDVAAEQSDLDWLEGQEKALESLVHRARALTGNPVSDSQEERILAHPDYRALNLDATSDGPPAP